MAEQQNVDKQEGQRVVNDFTITVGTVNGSGSQTSNMTMLRALFKMGIPVSGKNIFPSNIQGLPTWYTIRLSKDGFLARREINDIVVAMNPASFGQDLEKVAPGGAFFYADDIRWDINRDDIVTYPMPVKQLIRGADVPSRLRNYVANMVYVGILSQILGIDLGKIHLALDFHFGGKTGPVDLNFGIVKKAFDWAAENLEKKDKFYIEPMNATDGYVLADANNAAAFGAVFGGVQFVSWYPITPATSIAEKLEKYLNEFRKDPVEKGRNTFAVIQAEDELAAIGMAIGAGWGGLRSMTSTSGPGLSLMAEYSGLAYYAEVPIVIWVVQRVGPSTGLPTRTAQGDLTFTYFLGHGDTEKRYSFTKVGTDSNWVYIEAGQKCCFAINEDGLLYSWGNGGGGQLGHGYQITYYEPKLVEGLDQWELISSNSYTTIGIRNNGQLYSTGYNNCGQLCLNIPTPWALENIERTTFTHCMIGDTWKSVKVGYLYTILVKEDNSLWSVGYNSHGQLGLGDTDIHIYVTEVNDGNWLKITAGHSHVLCIDKYNNLYATGRNDCGQLGLGDTNDRHVLTKVEGTDWNLIAGGMFFSFAGKIA